jgi:hypothetical protein
MIEVASIVAGFLDVHDIENLMRTCKQIHSDNQVKKVCIDKIAEPYTRRLYPIDDDDFLINTRNGPQVPRAFRIHSQLGYRSANLLLGAPEFAEINSSFVHIRYGSAFFSFRAPSEDRSLVDDAFLSTVVGISFRELRFVARTMRIVLVVARAHLPTLTLRLESWSYDVL